MLAGENVTVTPCGAPLTLSFNDDLKPLCTDPQLTSVDAEPPLFSAIVDGDALKSQPAGVDTVRESGSVWVAEPPVATIRIE